VYIAAHLLHTHFPALSRLAAYEQFVWVGKKIKMWLHIKHIRKAALTSAYGIFFAKIRRKKRKKEEWRRKKIV
jgi:hypothetical protein